MKNIENERKLFEQWYVETNQSNINDSCWCIGGYYTDRVVQRSWEAWQASANREGFVLVPVEPTKNMINASVRRQWDELSYPMECMETLKYKAMIEASQENKDE